MGPQTMGVRPEKKDEQGMTCKSCRIRPAAGYVVRHGKYLANLCTKCWRKGENIAVNDRNYKWLQHKGAQ